MKIKEILSILSISTLLFLSGCKMGYITSPVTHAMFTDKNQTDVELNYSANYGSKGVSLVANHSLSSKTGITSNFTHAFPYNRKYPEKIIDKQLGGINYGEIGYIYYFKPSISKHIFLATTLGYGLGIVKTNNFDYKDKPKDFIVNYRFQRIFGQLNLYAVDKTGGLSAGLRLSQIVINNSSEFEKIITDAMDKKEMVLGFSLNLRMNLVRNLYSTCSLNVDTGYLNNRVYDMNLVLGVGYRF